MAACFLILFCFSTLFLSVCFLLRLFLILSAETSLETVSRVTAFLRSYVGRFVFLCVCLSFYLFVVTGGEDGQFLQIFPRPDHVRR